MRQSAGVFLCMQKFVPPPALVAFTAALGLLMAVLDSTVVNVALIPLTRSFETTLAQVQWVVTAYFLAQAAVIPVAGYLSGRFGERRMYLWCLSAFVVASACCGLAPTEGWLIVFRVFQGMAGGALFPLAQAIAFGAYSGAQRARASMIISIPILLAPAFGPTIGGWLIVNHGWQMIFMVNVPVGILTFVLAAAFLPEGKPVPVRVKVSFDYPGLFLCITGVVSMVYGFILVGQQRPETGGSAVPHPSHLYGWHAGEVHVFLVAGLILLGAFVFWELRRRERPVLDLRLFSSRDFLVSSVATWILAATFFGSVFLLPVFFQQIRQPALDAMHAGLALMPQGLGAGVGTLLGGWLYRRLGVRLLAAIGALLLAFSTWRIGHASLDSDGWFMMPWLLMRGFAFGLAFLTVQTKAMEKIPRAELPRASSLYAVTRQIASSMGLAFFVTFLASRTAVNATTLPSALAAVAAFNDVFIMAAIGCLLLLGFSALLPGRSSPAPVMRADGR